ncbi:SDR family oxidoreductase [Pelagibius sp. CAU 1746]|uniref:SDR family NAD(P)-dependent oxidoreductase n=1 Tax=Pelagibius sp. CAU 1746 TaxID=3140370 RepID=UPI00325B6094
MNQTSYRLDGKTAIITGGGSGIGAAVAGVFAEAGAHVVVAGRNSKTITDVAARNGGLAVQCDVTCYDQVEALFSQAAAKTGRVDILVNNAGMSGPVMPVAEMDLEAFRACVELNLFGALNCLKVAARVMCEAGRGSIINMSSLMGLQGYPMRSAYSATKFALLGMTEAIAREVGPAGVRVNALCPGAVSGELMDRVLARRAEAEGRSVEAIVEENYTSVSALKRWVDPREVGTAALFLASDASASVTGDRIKVDCGRF